MKKVSRIRYYGDTDTDTDSASDFGKASDSDWDDKDFDGLGFTSGDETE